MNEYIIYLSTHFTDQTKSLSFVYKNEIMCLDKEDGKKQTE